MKTYLLVTVFLLVGVSSAATSVYTAGHGDIELGEGNELELHLHLHEGAVVDGLALGEDTEYDPGDITIAVPNSTAAARPEGVLWDFVGNAAGEDFWILPESHTAAHSQGTPFVGIGSEEIDIGIFANDEIMLTLSDLTGPGQFSLYTLELNNPIVYMASQNGISPDDAVVLALSSGHEHFNFAFSAAGTYKIAFEVSAIVTETQELLTDQATYIFEVVPEPNSLILLALGIVGIWKRRK